MSSEVMFSGAVDRQASAQTTDVAIEEDATDLATSAYEAPPYASQLSRCSNVSGSTGYLSDESPPPSPKASRTGLDDIAEIHTRPTIPATRAERIQTPITPLSPDHLATSAVAEPTTPFTSMLDQTMTRHAFFFISVDPSLTQLVYKLSRSHNCHFFLQVHAAVTRWTSDPAYWQQYGWKQCEHRRAARAALVTDACTVSGRIRMGPDG